MNLIQVLIEKAKTYITNDNIFEKLGAEKVYVLSKIVVIYMNDVGQTRQKLLKNKRNNGNTVFDCQHLSLKQAQEMSISQATNARIAILIPQSEENDV